MEDWKPIEWTDSIYQVSSLGRIRRKTTPSIMFRAAEDGWVYPEGSIYSNGYRIVSIHCPGIHKSMSIHRLVAEAFIPNPENKPCVNHKDGDKLNNAVDNLEWVTYKKNSRHAVKIGLIPTGKDSRLYGKTGEKHPCHKALLGNQHRKGKRLSSEAREKISKALMGNKNGAGNAGRKRGV